MEKDKLIKAKELIGRSNNILIVTHDRPDGDALSSACAMIEYMKQYRDEKLATVGMYAVFPIWLRDTKELAHSFIESGFKSIVTCVDTQVLDGEFSGREYDKKFLKDLGIPGDRISTVSYGEERPVATGTTEEAWAKNRRDEFTLIK